MQAASTAVLPMLMVQARYPSARAVSQRFAAAGLLDDGEVIIHQRIFHGNEQRVG